AAGLRGAVARRPGAPNPMGVASAPSRGRRSPGATTSPVRLRGVERQAPRPGVGQRRTMLQGLPATGRLIHPSDGAVKGLGVDVVREPTGLVSGPVDAAFPSGDGDDDELFG